ncbi:hypothetical protein V1502_06335 [Bacillus sp. SCS-153A]|uniref:hypothetical protein n=1 Tax=Rossellomorea sedimentorum TaxID=3115294 RepID=UPI003905ACF7
MTKQEHMEMIILPTDQGEVKVYVYGFKPFGSWGHVFVQLNDLTVDSKGYNRKKTIIRTLTKLHQVLVNSQE